MPRRAPVISLDPDRLASLRRVLGAPSTSQALMLRLLIVLKANQGETNQTIAASLGVTCATVGRWRQAFAQRGLEGLNDRPRQGRPRKYGPEVLQQVQTGLRRCLRSRFAITVRTLAHEMQVPRSTLHQLLTGGRRLSSGSAVTAATGHVPSRVALRGLFLTPDEAAFVCSVSEDLPGHPPAAPALAYLRPRRGVTTATRAVFDAMRRSAALFGGWRPRRGRSATLTEFLAAVSRSDDERLCVIRTGRRRGRVAPPTVLFDLTLSAWVPVAQVALLLLRLDPPAAAVSAAAIEPAPAIASLSRLTA